MRSPDQRRRAIHVRGIWVRVLLEQYPDGRDVAVPDSIHESSIVERGGSEESCAE